MDFRRLAGLDDPRVLSEAVTVIGWRKSQYSKEFWQELATRCAKEIVGKPVSLRIAFKKVAAGWGKSYHDIRKGKYDIELDPMWGDTMNAETTAHEIAHVRQYMSGMDLSDKDALEKDAVSYEPVGERVLKQMQAEGWKPRFEFPKEPGLLGKKLSDLTPDELEQAIAMMRAKKLKGEAVEVQPALVSIRTALKAAIEANDAAAAKVPMKKSCGKCWAAIDKVKRDSHQSSFAHGVKCPECKAAQNTTDLSRLRANWKAYKASAAAVAALPQDRATKNALADYAQWMKSIEDFAAALK